MLCYKDMAFCTDAKTCQSSHNCFRLFSVEDSARVQEVGIPVAWGSFKEHCKYYGEVKDAN